MYMKILTTTTARKNLKSMVDRVKYQGEVFAIGRRNSIDALVMQFPAEFNAEVNDISNVNTYSPSFDFLKKEPDLYSVSDLKKNYV